MNLGLFLSPGDSLQKQQRSGQLDRLVKYYLQPYSKVFKQIYLFSYEDSGKRFTLPENLTLVAKPKLILNYLYQLIMVFIHRKIIKTIDINRVFQAPGGIPAVMAKVLFKKPYVISNNYDYVRFARVEKRPFLAYLLRLIIPLILKSADKIITPKIIPNGIDPLVFKPAGQPEQYLVFSVGRLVRQKNYALLIKAVSLSRFKQKIKLVIIGTGPLQLQLQRMAVSSGVNLKLLPNLAHREVLNWYQKAAVFALTSQIEGQPKALLEAMSCARSCLTTAFPGNLIQDQLTGLVGKDARQLAAKLDQLLTNSALGQKLGRAARQKIIKSFDIRKLIKKEIKLLQQTAKQ